MSNIEDDLKIVKRYLRNSSYKESDSDFFKNGGWEMVDLEIPKAMANVLSEREQDKARIKELEDENKRKDMFVEMAKEVIENSILKQKVKEILIEIQEEYNKLDKEIDKQIKDKNKDYYKCKENIAIMQTLAYCRDKFEGLLEEK